MRRIALAWLCIATLSGKDVYDLCGTFAGRTQQELFLHRRNMLGLARANALGRAAVPLQQDIGNIAVIDDGNGVIGRRNAFDLDRKTVGFSPTASGYSVQLGDDTFDATAVQAGSHLTLADDDTQRIALPFSFRFFGKDYVELWVNSNGTISFGNGDTDYSGSFGHFAAGPPTIAGLFADLSPEDSSAGVYVLADASHVVVTWSVVPLANSANFGRAQLQTFQIRLFRTGRIELAYRSSQPPDALVGITAGRQAPVDLVALSSAPATPFVNGIAEVFSSADAVDVIAASQRFYQTHDDAYDYLVFYNAASVRASAGAVAYEITTRSAVEGIGDTAIEDGRQYGSPKRLKAVMNMGPLSQYPVSPNGIVSARAPIGDTPVTLLAHEAGHLFLALVSVADPATANSTPMLTSDQAHWAFPFNSEASVMGGERIRDNGTDTIPRFTTTATVEGYGPLDQYLMGLRGVDEVPSTFVVLNSGNSTRTSQVGVNFSGNPLTVDASAIQARYGRRTPDVTVAQRSFRFGVVLIVPAGMESSAVTAAALQVEQYRQEFEKFYARATSGRAAADTVLRKGVQLSVAPAAGILEGTERFATLELAEAPAVPQTFTIRNPNHVLAAPAFVIVPAGASKVSFSLYGARTGVEELTLIPPSETYETVTARVQVNRAPALRIAVTGTSLRVEDVNRLPYANVPARVDTLITTAAQSSGADGSLVVGASNASVYFPDAVAHPRIDEGGVVDAFTYTPKLTANGYVSIFGYGLENARIRLNGSPVDAMYTSDRQVNFRAPANISSTPVRVTLETPQGVALAVVTFSRN